VEWKLLSELPEPDRREVLASARRRRFDRNEIIFHEGDPAETLHLVERGRVGIRVTTPMGDVATLNIRREGEVFGEMALVSPEHRRTATAIALSPVETLSLHRDKFEELRRAYASMDRLLVEILAAHLRETTSRLLEALFVPAETRVVRRIVDLAGVFGDGGAGTVISLTQDDLATLAGTTRPTANKVVKQVEAAGCIVVGRGRIEIRDADALRAKARYR
jgi:CRP-like cAMP-binding protein